jgi:HEAT repeat-containing protein 5
MQRRDPHILAAMDGREGNDATSITSGSDPTAFFYVVFGLIYEALVQASTDSASSVATRDVTITALQALASLVNPEYAGSAVLEPAIFEELGNLCYRMAMTEPPEVQVHLITAVSSFVNSQCRKISTTRCARLMPLYLVTNDSFSQQKLSELPPDSPINQCLRICAHVLKQAIPSSRETSSGGSLNRR